MNKIIVIISDKNNIICDKLNSMGFKLIYTECVDGFISYEQNHADIQCICVKDTVFVLKNCGNLKNELQRFTSKIITTQSKAEGTYPNNILLNAKIIGKNIIGKIDALDIRLIEFCKELGYNFIDVKQGYSGCSILKITDNAVITTDENIYRTLSNSEIDVLKISQEDISLYGSKRGEQGLIGGASINLGDKILFFGDIRKHADFENIKAFCNKSNIKFEYIENMELTDIGGGILLNISQ